MGRAAKKRLDVKSRHLIPESRFPAVEILHRSHNPLIFPNPEFPKVLSRAQKLPHKHGLSIDAVRDPKDSEVTLVRGHGLLGSRGSWKPLTELLEVLYPAACQLELRMGKVQMRV